MLLARTDNPRNNYGQDSQTWSDVSTPSLSLPAEVNISSYPARILAGLFFFCRAEILNSGGFVQKYSDQGVSCKNIGQ